MKCKYASSGCNYPEGDCIGLCDQDETRAQAVTAALRNPRGWADAICVAAVLTVPAGLMYLRPDCRLMLFILAAVLMVMYAAVYWSFCYWFDSKYPNAEKDQAKYLREAQRLQRKADKQVNSRSRMRVVQIFKP